MLRCQKHRVQLGVELVIDQRHLELVLEIRYGAEALDDHAALLAPRIVGQQLVGVLDLHVRDILRHTPQQLDALLRRKHRMLGAVDHHADGQPVEDPGGAANDVEVSVRDGVKAAGIDRRFHRDCSRSLFLR